MHNIVQLLDAHAWMAVASCVQTLYIREGETWSTHTLDSIHIVKADLDRVWSFFSSPANLGRITPRSMGFVIHTPDPVTDRRCHHRLHGPSACSASRRGGRRRIDEVEAPHPLPRHPAQGPLQSWVHEHRFTLLSEGGVRLDDHVEYELPLGPLGSLAPPTRRARAARAPLRLPCHGHRPDLRAGRRPSRRASGQHRRGRRDRLRGCEIAARAAPARPPRDRALLARRGSARTAARRHRAAPGRRARPGQPPRSAGGRR